MQASGLLDRFATCLQSSGKAVRLGAATFLLNCAVLQGECLSSGTSLPDRLVSQVPMPLTKGVFSKAAAVGCADAELKVQVLSGLSELLSSASEAEPETLYRCRFHDSDFEQSCSGACQCACAAGDAISCSATSWDSDLLQLLACRTLVALGTVLHQDSMTRSIAVDLEVPQQVKQRQVGATGKVAEASQEVLRVFQQ